MTNEAIRNLNWLNDGTWGKSPTAVGGPMQDSVVKRIEGLVDDIMQPMGLRINHNLVV